METVDLDASFVARELVNDGAYVVVDDADGGAADLERSVVGDADADSAGGLPRDSAAEAFCPCDM
jgi:hypothetical protein